MVNKSRVEELSEKRVCQVIEAYRYLPPHFNKDLINEITSVLNQMIGEDGVHSMDIPAEFLINLLSSVSIIKAARNIDGMGELLSRVGNILLERLDARDTHLIIHMPEIARIYAIYPPEKEFGMEIANTFYELCMDTEMSFYPHIHVLEYLALYKKDLSPIVSAIKSIDEKRTAPFMLIRYYILKGVQESLVFCFTPEYNKLTHSSIHFICQSPFLSSEKNPELLQEVSLQ